jgi:hypothetical protein
MKIWFDKKYMLLNRECHMLVPFWGRHGDNRDPDDKRFDKYISEGNSIFTVTTYENADLLVYPLSPTDNHQIFEQFQRDTENKRAIAFFNDDSDIDLNYRNGMYILRTSFYKSRQKPTEFAVPGWSMDWGKLPESPWNTKPIVSFCGQQDGFGIRSLAMNVLEGDNRVTTNFIKRTGSNTWGSWIRSGDKNTGHRIRQEFISNMLQGNYCLCARGGGNFSYRIYEAMMSGRIPLFINTDCVLPYDFEIDWFKLFPVVDVKDIQSAPNILLEYHNNSKNKFGDIQKSMRELWEEWISPIGYFKNLYRHFNDAK